MQSETVVMTSAGLLVFLCVALFGTLGHSRYPDSVRGQMVVIVPTVLLIYVMMHFCKQMHRAWIDPLTDGMIFGVIIGGFYLASHRTYSDEE